jgi:Bestrophin, RFP-TM, chloride channel
MQQRTFLFIWTFTIPLVLRGVVSDTLPAMAFVFFLTYGFIGLEVCSIKLMNPFGEGTNDLNITGMRHSTVIGIEKDLQLFGEQAKLRDPRQEYSRHKAQPSTKGGYDDAQVYTSESVETPYRSAVFMDVSHDNMYHPPGC